MRITDNKTKLSISLDTRIASQLPKLNRSMFIESVLRDYFRRGNMDALYEHIKQRLIKDGLLEDYRPVRPSAIQKDGPPHGYVDPSNRLRKWDADSEEWVPTT